MNHATLEGRFARPRSQTREASAHLFVANCGPRVGIPFHRITHAFSFFGEVIDIRPADDSGARVLVSFSNAACAQAALEALNGTACPHLDGRVLHVSYSVRVPCKLKADKPVGVSLTTSDLGIPGLHLWHEFISTEEEKELLAAVDSRPWKNLAKRRVQHYGYEFLYETRNVDATHYRGELPSFVSFVLEKMSSCLDDKGMLAIDQLTVNDYPVGVGLSPHIDTHSAFDRFIFSLSLGGPCIMEFRKYFEGAGTTTETDHDMKVSEHQHEQSFIRKAVFLPPRSMLLMSDEARYAWQHYIPHHKVDVVGEDIIRRSRRVSFTFRKVYSFNSVI